MHLLDESVPERPAANNASDVPYEIVETAEKGRGVVARRLIRKHEIFMTDYAALVLDRDLPNNVKTIQGYFALRQAVLQLQNPQRVLGLSQQSKDAQDPVEDVIRTNAFDNTHDQIVLYPDIAVSRAYMTSKCGRGWQGSPMTDGLVTEDKSRM